MTTIIEVKLGKPSEESIALAKRAIQVGIESGRNAQLREDPWDVHGYRSLPNRIQMCIPKPSEDTKVHIDIIGVIWSMGYAEQVWGNDPHIPCRMCNIQHGDSIIGIPAPSDFHKREMATEPNPLIYIRDNTKLEAEK